MKNIKFIKGAEPFFGKYKKNILNDINFCLKTGNLSNGRFVNKFEKDLKKFFKSKYALSINSGGTALELAILSMGFRNKEIIVPSQTFIASPNSILRAGLKPVYCDIKYNTGCLDPQEVIKKINKKTCAIMYVHMFGIMTDDIFKIRSICKKKNLLLIEDASHAHGAKLKGVYAGNIGDIGCFSLYATKIMTTGEGGFILTKRKKIFERIKSLRNYGKDEKSQKFVHLSNNFRLSEISSILGIYQLKLLNSFIKHRTKIAKIYIKRLKNNQYLNFFNINIKNQNSFWRFPLYLSAKIIRSKFQKKMNELGVRITWMYDPLCHLQPLYKQKKKFKLKTSEEHIKYLINLPTHMNVNEKMAEKICDKVTTATNQLIKKI